MGGEYTTWLYPFLDEVHNLDKLSKKPKNCASIIVFCEQTPC